MKAYVEAIEAESMHDVTGFGQAEHSYLPGDIRLRLKTQAGTFWIPWRDAQPLIGACIEIDVENARVAV